MPSGDYRRFSSIHTRLCYAVQRVYSFFGGLRDSLLCDWSYARESFRGRRPSEPESHRPIVTCLAACPPIVIAPVVLPRGWFLNFAALIAMEVFLWWVWLVPVRRTHWVLRKLLRMVVFTCILVGFGLLAANFQGRTLFGWRVGGTELGGVILVLTGLWGMGLLWLLISLPRRALHPGRTGTFQPAGNMVVKPQPAGELRVPRVRFADVGGMEEAKQQIREIVESRLNPQKYVAYGVDRNGVLLYGPRGSGKTFLAEATAGEFSLNYHYVSSTQLVTTWTGESEASIRGVFMRARANRPALLFIDEIDALGSIRQNLGTGGDPGGAGRSYNNMAIELMQSIDQARSEAGLLVMAATNFIEGLDEALIREGRFDLKIRVDLPDEATREKIFQAQLSRKPWEGFDLREFARRTPGASAAKIRALVDQAALFAARENRKIDARDLQRALEEYGGKDRPPFQPVAWEDVVVNEQAEQELRSLIRVVSNPFAAERMRLPVPMGVLLLGPPGTGKTMIARLIATESKRSFLPITSAEIPDPKAVSRVFTRARENSPSLIFMDEMDSLLPANPGYLNQYYVQIVEQFLIEISALQPEHNVFLVGTTNHPENIDPRVLRGGRFSEKIEIGLPGRKEIGRLLAKYLKDVQLEPSLGYDYLTEWLTGTTPANLEAMVATAKRYAFERSGDDRLAPLTIDDFERAAGRVIGQVPPLPSARSTQA